MRNSIISLLLLTALHSHGQSAKGLSPEPTESTCIRNLKARPGLAPFYADQALALASCTCAASHLSRDTILKAYVSSLTAESNPKTHPTEFSALSALMLSCAVDAIREKSAHFSGLAPNYARALTYALLDDDQLPKFKGAQAQDPKGCLQSVYPEAARMAVAEGKTVLEYAVSESGKLTDVFVIQSSGSTPHHKLLDYTAAVTGMKCKFEPAEENGKPVAGRARIEVIWQLQ